MERTPLITAAEAGHEEIVKCLIEAGACVEAKDKDGETALVCAARKRHEAIVRLLIEAGASTMARDLLNRPLIKAYPDVLRGASLSPSRSGDRPQLRREETERTPVERLSASTDADLLALVAEQLSIPTVGGSRPGSPKRPLSPVMSP